MAFSVDLILNVSTEAFQKLQMLQLELEICRPLTDCCLIVSCLTRGLHLSSRPYWRRIHVYCILNPRALAPPGLSKICIS
jgi:hypothetical protein